MAKEYYHIAKSKEVKEVIREKENLIDKSNLQSILAKFRNQLLQNADKSFYVKPYIKGLCIISKALKILQQIFRIFG